MSKLIGTNLHAEQISRILSKTLSKEDLLDLFLLHLDEVLKQNILHQAFIEDVINGVLNGVDKHVCFRSQVRQKHGNNQRLSELEVVYLGRLIVDTKKKCGGSVDKVCQQIAENWPEHIRCPSEWQTTKRKQMKTIEIGDALARWYRNNKVNWGYLFDRKQNSSLMQVIDIK